jgi:hypothetical protein
MLYVACTALVALAGYYVLIPLFKEPKGNLEVELLAETELDRLLNRKAIVYTNLKDLEFEYKLGRLSDADFHRLEAGYKAEAAQLLQKLDQLGVEKNIDEIIERDVATRRSKLFSSASPPASSIRCPACGNATIAGKKFCADCGHQLQ